MDLEKRIRESTKRREGVLMPHVYYGDPTEEFSRRLISTMTENGADVLELGIPFSDPTADGPTFQAACERALRNGVTPPICIKAIAELREAGLDIPIIVTTYYNIPYVRGVGEFMEEIRTAGAQALIVPNLPHEEAETLIDEGRKHGIHVILMVAPTTTEGRLRRIAEMASGFIYVMNVEGVTGARDTLGDSTLKLVRRVREHTDLPILAGFGISERKHAAAVISAGADGVIAGSAFAKVYGASIEAPEAALPEIARLVRELKLGCSDGWKGRTHSSSRDTASF